ncbi:MAG: hypothetical protein ABIE36_01820 [Candidatus Diapherotrites archaeon]
MENQNKLIVGLVLGLIIIAIFLIVLTPNIRTTKSQEKEEVQIRYVVLEESYSPQIQNPNNVLLADSYEIQPIYRTIYRDSCGSSCSNYYRDWEDRENYYKKYRDWEDREREYSYYGKKHTREEFLGNYVNEYKVYVSNKERAGEYFTVIFNFKDQRGFEYSESITQYLKARERKLFLYKDVQSERREIVNWDYEVKKE